MIKYVFFDLDGTITEPADGITSSARYALEQFGIKVKSNTELLAFIGPPLQDSFKNFYGMDEKMAFEAVKIYRKHYLENGIFKCSLYPNIVTLLRKLKELGYILVVATSKPQPYAIDILKHFNILDYFTFVSGASLDTKRSKKEDIIKYAMENLNIKDSSQIIMIGDRKFDVIGARKHNIDCIGVLYGYGNLQEFLDENCKYIVKDVLDILNILK